MPSQNRQRGRARPRAAETELERTNRRLRMLSDSNQALIRATDEATLLAQVCRIAVEVGGYRMAWIGFADEDTSRRLRPVAHAGFEEGYLTAGGLPSGHEGPVATAMLTGEPCIVREIPTDPAFADRRKAALERGYLAAVALPLIGERGAFGVLKIYSADPDPFDPDEVAILAELAGDVAFGVGTLRLRIERERSARTLCDLARQLETLLDSVPDFISRFDAEGRFTYISPAIERITGNPPSAALGRRLSEVPVSDDPAEVQALDESLMRVLAGGPAERLEVHFATPAGPTTFEVRHIPERDASGRVVSALGIATDLTLRRAAERQITILSRALDEVAEGIFLMRDERPEFLYVNQSAANALGYTREELTGGMSVLDIDSGVSPESWRALMEHQRQHRRLRIESLHRTRDGRLFPIEVTGSAFTYEGHLYNLAITRDITERRANERALEEREAAYRTLAEHLPDMIIRYDRDLHRTYVNPAFAAAVGNTPAALIGTRLGEAYRSDLTAPNAEFVRGMTEMVRSVFQTGAPITRESVWWGPTGRRTFVNQILPEHDASGAVVSVLGLARDITDLKETERQLRSLAEHSPDIILRFDREGRYLYANSALGHLTGVPVERHLGQLFGSVTGRPEAEPWVSLRRQVGALFESGASVETELPLPLPDGIHDFNIRLVPEPGDDGAIVSVLAVVRDVTLQKRAEAALRASEQRFRQVTENIDEVFWLTDAAKTEMIYASPAYERVFGQPRAALEADPRAWIALVHPEDRNRVLAAMTRQADGEYDLEYRIVRPDGVRWIHDRAVPIRDESGQVYRIAGVAEDVTVRRELEEQLRQAQKMEAVGRLAGGIAHDFNNMLAVVEMQATLLLEDAPPASEEREGLAEILGAARRAGNLTRQLLTFSRRQVAQPVDLDVSEAIVGMTRLLRRVLGEDVALETRFAAALPRIHADPSMMEQVLMNLAINARDAMPAGGRLTITLEAVSVPAEQVAGHPGRTGGRYVCLTVTDTGCGIPAEALPRIFEPFFTTKEVGKGTGLGLATVFAIVDQHQGWVEVDSVVGEGTTFRVFLPAVLAPAAAPPCPAAAEPVPGGSETILLVEDEPAVRAVTRAALERFGYQVIEAASAAEGLVAWERQAPRIDLLVTDLIMPGGISGRQLAEQLLAARPGLRVLYVTGYSPDVVQQLLHLTPDTHLLQKPFAPQELARRVRRALDPPAAPR